MEVKELKFRLTKGKGAVHELTDAAGVTHLPGEVVDLPASYEGEAWLERVDPVPVVAAVPGRVEPVEPVVAEQVASETVVPFEALSKRTRKKLKS
jgi:hypothetical protein